MENDYVTEALDLLHGPSVEIEPARTTIERRDGEFKEVEKPAFVKISTAFKNELPNISGDALKVWLFISLSINRNTSRANPGLRTISTGVKLAINTVQKAIKELEGHKLLSVNRDTRHYNIYEVPEYVSANKAEPTVSNGDTDTQSVSNPSQSVSNSGQSVSPSVILNQRTRENQNTSSLSSKDYEQANAKVTAIIENSKLAEWNGRSSFRPDHWPLVDWYHRVTGQDCPKSKQKDWQKAVMVWNDNGLKVEDLQAAFEMDIKWRGVFTSPSQLTEKAIALRAQKLCAELPERPEYKPFVFED